MSRYKKFESRVMDDVKKSMGHKVSENRKEFLTGAEIASLYMATLYEGEINRLNTETGSLKQALRKEKSSGVLSSFFKRIGL